MDLYLLIHVYQNCPGTFDHLRIKYKTKIRKLAPTSLSSEMSPNSFWTTGIRIAGTPNIVFEDW